ncbi:MAG TPA: DUF4397 domain-containing protein [Streptosporangiaceae bacterium]|jgi:hypothetical protein
MTHQAPVSRITRLLAACALAFGLLAAVAPAAMASPATRVSGVGWIRLAHLSPNAPAVDVYLYSEGDTSAMIVLHHVIYGTVSPYETVAAGSYTVAMRGANTAPSSPVVLSTTVHIVAGHAYTVAGMGPAAGLRLQVIDDTLTTPKGRSLVRVIQASLKDKRVTVNAGSQALASNLTFGSVTSYVPLAPGTVNLHVAGGSMSASSTLTVAADTTHTVVVLDDPGHLTLDVLTDAAGSNALPAGGASTGFGGMAPRPGSSPLPWAAAMAFGALLAGGGALWLRRNRRPVIHGSHVR